MAAEKRLGNRADLNIAFVNKVAAIVEKSFPGIALETFAYQFTLESPRTVRPARNVKIRVCLIEANAARPMEDASNMAYYNCIKGWCAISDNVNIWNYVVNFTNAPMAHAGIATIVKDLRLFQRFGVKDIFCEDFGGCGHLGWFVVYRYNLLTRMMVNPNLDEQSYRLQFFHEYYGPSAEQMLNLFNLFETAMGSAPKATTCYQFDTSHWLNAQTLAKGDNFLAQAESQATPGSNYAKRVALIRLAFDWTKIWRHENTVLHKVTQTQKVVSDEWIKNIRAGLEERIKNTPRTPGWIGFYTRLGMKYQDHLKILDGYLAPEPPFEHLPEQFKNVQQDDLIILPQARYSVASGQKEVKDYKMPADEVTRLSLYGYTWAMRVDLPTLLANNKWDIFVEMRFPDKISAPGGIVAKAGVYAYGTNFAIKTEFPVNADILSKEHYTLVSLGSTDFSRDGQIYIAANKNSTVPELLIGRIFLRRIKQQK